MSQEKIFKAAINMCELGIADFEDCVDTLKKFNGNQDQACEFLIDRNRFKRK